MQWELEYLGSAEDKYFFTIVAKISTERKNGRQDTNKMFYCIEDNKIYNTNYLPVRYDKRPTKGDAQKVYRLAMEYFGELLPSGLILK